MILTLLLNISVSKFYPVPSHKLRWMTDRSHLPVQMHANITKERKKERNKERGGLE